MLADSELVAMARRGDRDAFGELIARHRKRCVDLACAFLRNRDDAEDEAQSAFLKAYQHFDQYEATAGFVAWLASIVKNECLLVLRIRRRRQFESLEDRFHPPARSNPEAELRRREIIRHLEREIRRLPLLLREVLLLADVRELPLDRVARRLGVTLPAAKSRLFRARRELGRRMRRHLRRPECLKP